MTKPISELKRIFDTVHTGYNEYSWLLYFSSASAILSNYLRLTAGVSANFLYCPLRVVLPSSRIYS